jgi:hypothetical protein
METVAELIARVSQELGPKASDEEVGEKVLQSIEALPESDRALLLEQLVKDASSGQLRHLDKEAGVDGHAGDGRGVSDTGSTP